MTFSSVLDWTCSFIYFIFHSVKYYLQTDTKKNIIIYNPLSPSLFKKKLYLDSINSAICRPSDLICKSHMKKMLSLRTTGAQTGLIDEKKIKTGVEKSRDIIPLTVWMPFMLIW